MSIKSALTYCTSPCEIQTHKSSVTNCEALKSNYYNLLSLLHSIYLLEITF